MLGLCHKEEEGEGRWVVVVGVGVVVRPQVITVLPEVQVELHDRELEGQCHDNRKGNGQKSVQVTQWL